MATVAASATALLALVPSLHFAIDRPPLHAMLESVAGLAAGFVTLLLFGRFRRTQRRGDLLMCASLALLATSDLAVGALPYALVEFETVPHHPWAMVPVNLLAAVFFGAAALSGERRAAPREAARVLGITSVALIAIGAAALLLGPSLPAPVTAAPASPRPVLDPNPVAQLTQYLAVFGFAGAAISFAVRARRLQDAMLRGLGIAAILAAFSRLNFVIYPTHFTQIVSTGDLFRMLVHLLMLVICVREIRSYWEGRTEGAVLAERRRIARDLHDSVAQDLAFILRRAQRLAPGHDGTDLDHISAAARRALTGSRRAIEALTRDPDEPLDVSIATAARGIADGASGHLLLDLERGIRLPPVQSDALVRIACEAVANATDHGSPEAIRIELRNRDGVRLRVSDDGTGFDPDAPAPRPGRGFGLISMHERARAAGGELRLTSAHGLGTRVEVVLP